MNDDTISRKSVIDAVHTATYRFICGAEDGDEMTDADILVLSINKAVVNAIKALPSAQPQRMRGQWRKSPIGEPYFVLCSECRYMTDNESNYCPYCGADMRGTANDD